MGSILCATRGGEESSRTEEEAVRMASASGAMLIFFYVVDMEFLAQAQYKLRSDVVHEELEEMAEFLMTMAVERAQEQDVQATALIRDGVFLDELVIAAAEVGAVQVILGRPHDADEAERLAEMVARLSSETGIPFTILP